MVWSIAAGSPPGWTSTCQSTATELTARDVIVALEAVRKAPRAAINATDREIPAAVASSLPPRLRTSPPSHVAITRHLL
jgi:hypothetical protein